MIIATFDMGVKNFAFCVEQVPELGEMKITRNKFTLVGTPTEEYQEQLDMIFNIGNLIEAQKVDIHGDTIISTCLNLTNFLNKYSKLWDKVDVFLIEQQMSYGTNNTNVNALRLSQHCISYFMTIYGSFKIIEEFSSTHKTRYLGCQKELRKNYRARKNFSQQMALKILTSRNDPFLTFYSTLDKQDDIADCLLMIQVYKIKFLSS